MLNKSKRIIDLEQKIQNLEWELSRLVRQHWDLKGDFDTLCKKKLNCVVEKQEATLYVKDLPK